MDLILTLDAKRTQCANKSLRRPAMMINCPFTIFFLSLILFIGSSICRTEIPYLLLMISSNLHNIYYVKVKPADNITDINDQILSK